MKGKEEKADEGKKGESEEKGDGKSDLKQNTKH